MLRGRTVIANEPPGFVVFYEGLEPAAEFYWMKDEADRRATRRSNQGYHCEVITTEEVLRRMHHERTLMLEVSEDDANDA